VKLVKPGGSVKTVKARRLCVASNVLFDKHLNQVIKAIYVGSQARGSKVDPDLQLEFGIYL
jgi:hypothetical protein